MGILFYIDNIFGYWSAAGVIYPIVISGYISLDTIVMSFPRRVAFIEMMLIVLINLWNIFRFTFLMKDCKEILLPWGIFGEEISYCTIKRLIFQTITSLIVSAMITLFAGRKNNMCFWMRHAFDFFFEIGFETMDM